jgi:hypothetical protein
MARPTERQICTNLWAYLHWLRAAGRATLAGREDVRRWAATEPERWAASIRAFARLTDAPSHLLLPPGPQGQLVLRSRRAVPRRVWSADALAQGDAGGLPSGLTRVLAAVHPAEALTDAAAVLLLDADLRPDDRVLVAGAAFWPWVWALREGATLILGPAAEPAELRCIAEEDKASILVAPWATLACFRPAHAGLRRGVDPASGQVIDFD